MDKDGHIATGQLRTVLKTLGQNPSDKEVAEFVQACAMNGKIEFNQFCSYLVNYRRKVRYDYNDLVPAVSPHVF